MSQSSKTPSNIVPLKLPSSASRFYDFAGFRLDVRERLLLRDGSSLPLTPKVFETLVLLVRSQGQLLTKEALMASLWPETAVEESNLTQNIFVLRKTLGETPDGRRYIETVPRVGYRFVAQVTLGDEAAATPAHSPAPAAEARSAESPAAVTGGEASAAPSMKPARWPWMAAGALLALAAGLWWWTARSHRVAPEPPTFHRLGHSGRDAWPSASPGGRVLAFTSDRDGQRRIWLRQLDGGAEHALTAGPDDRPRLSPDGSAVLFVHQDRKLSVLYRAAVLGGEPRRLVDAASDGDWSPDGRRVVFIRARESGGASLGIAAADGSGARELVGLPGGVDSPRWSADGLTIALRQAGASTGVHDTILVVDPETAAIRAIRPPGPPGRISAPEWSGDELIYAQSESLTSTRAGVSSRVMRLDPRSGQAQTAFWVPERVRSIAVVGPGRLAFDAESTLENLRELHLGPAAASAERWLTRGRSNDRQPAYAPSGDSIVFSSDKSGNLDLWQISTQTGAMRQITDDKADDWDPAFVGRGKQLVWSSNRSGPFEIWIANADGSGARQLTQDGVDAENPTATPDGEWIVYSSAHPAKAGIWKIRARGGGATRLVSGTAVWPELSPDGQYAAYRDAPYDWPHLRGRPVWMRVVRLADGAVVPFSIQVNDGLSAGRARWMPDGRALAFIAPDETGTSSLFVQEFAPGRDTTPMRRRLGGLGGLSATESFSISPDGAHLAVAAWEQLSGLMLAEHVPGIFPRR